MLLIFSLFSSSLSFAASNEQISSKEKKKDNARRKAGGNNLAQRSRRGLKFVIKPGDRYFRVNPDSDEVFKDPMWTEAENHPDGCGCVCCCEIRDVESKRKWMKEENERFQKFLDEQIEQAKKASDSQKEHGTASS